MRVNFKNILIDGLPATGKKELGQKLAKRLSSSFFNETMSSFVKNALRNFYHDPEKNALLLELTFLIQRYKNYSTILLSDLYKPEKAVFTYSLERSKIYATYTLNDYELKVFDTIYTMLAKPITIKHDLIIFLYSSPKTIIRKLKETKRVDSKLISLEYTEGLLKLYYNHYSRLRGTPVIFLDIEKINRYDEKTIENIVDSIREAKPGINIFNPLHP